MNDPTTTGVGLKIFGITLGEKLLNTDYWNALVKQEPLITRDHRQMIEWLAQGKVYVIIGIEPEIFAQIAKAGASIEKVSVKEGTNIESGTGGMSILANPAHPAAARVFVNWFLTREGQTLASKAMSIQSGRADVSTEHLDPRSIRKAGVNYIIGDSEDVLLKQGEYMQLAKQIFSPIIK